MPASAYKQLYHNNSLIKLEPVQASLKVYNSIGMNVIGACIL